MTEKNQAIPKDKELGTTGLQTVQAIGYNVDMKKRVDILRKTPKKIYTLKEMEAYKIIPWANNGRTIRKIIDQDKRGKNLLASRVTGIGSQKRYTVPTSGLIRYLQTYGPFLIGTVRNSQKKHGR